jgi:hypothetical protein
MAHGAKGFVAVGAVAVDRFFFIVTVTINQPSACVAWTVNLFFKSDHSTTNNSTDNKKINAKV